MTAVSRKVNERACVDSRSRRETAAALFREGYNCAQALLAVYGADYGIGREQAFKLGAPFGGGIANTGDICGAVSGALMVIGLRYGSTEPGGWLRKAVFQRTCRTFLKRFSRLQGCIECREIRHRIKEQHGALRRGTHCTALVVNTAVIIEELLEGRGLRMHD